MTNIELDTLFTVTNIECDNIFDVYEELHKHEDEYKEMNISAIIPTIYEAYEIHHRHEDISVKIMKAIGNADWTPILEALDFNKILEKIPVEYRDTLKTLMENATEQI